MLRCVRVWGHGCGWRKLMVENVVGVEYNFNRDRDRDKNKNVDGNINEVYDKNIVKIL